MNGCQHLVIRGSDSLRSIVGPRQHDEIGPMHDNETQRQGLLNNYKMKEGSYEMKKRKKEFRESL